MGADVFIAFYGLEFPVPDDVTLTKIETQKDARVVLARKHCLDWWVGRLTDHASYHLLVGKKIGQFGIESCHGAEMTDAEIDSMREQTRVRLVSAGFQESPRMLFKYESEY